MGIKRNLEEIDENIKRAAEKSGRRLEDIKLVAVTKFASVEQINELISLGRFDIGENKAQSILTKYELINPKANWNFIGHLQTNKVKSILDKTSMIHSLDRLSLAEEIQKQAEVKDLTVPALIQVNIAEEESKYGIKAEKIESFYEVLGAFNRLKIQGIMAIMPFSQPEQLRPYFKQVKNLLDGLRERYGDKELKYLSMGMSNDYQVAIEEGANIVRIGSAIFNN